MIWIVLAIIVGALIIANALKQKNVATHFPIQDPNNPEYKLAYKIIDDYIDVFFALRVQEDLARLCDEKLKNSKGSKEKKENAKQAQESRKGLNEMVNNFWSQYGGYRKQLDPTIIPRAVWPDELINKFDAKYEGFK
jgi:hypothetical protein